MRKSPSSLQRQPLLLLYLWTTQSASGAGGSGSVCALCHVRTSITSPQGTEVKCFLCLLYLLDWVDLSPVAKADWFPRRFFLSLAMFQAQKSGSGGDTQAAEDLLLLSKPLTDLISLLIPLVRAHLFVCLSEHCWHWSNFIWISWCFKFLCYFNCF